MLTRKVLIQVIVFAVVGVVAVVYAAMRYAGIGSALVDPGYTVRLDLADGGGIFTNAEVTYRGVTVGKVTTMRLTSNGIEVGLHIDSGTPPIPADLQAAVADRSAVGEQYVDLMPSTTGGPFLADGSVISQNRTTVPLATQNLLANLDQLANSVPTSSLQTVVNELNAGFSGTGPDLRKLLDSVSDFTRTAQSQLPQTTQLLNTGKTVLDTQNDEAGSIESFSTSLRQVAAQLRTSDSDLRELIANAPAAATQVTDLLNESGQQLGGVLANLLTTANILVTRESGLEMAMVAYPELAGAAGTVVPGDGTAHLGLALNLFNPPPCTQGYQNTQHRAGNVTSKATLNTSAYCALSPSTGVDVRGAENAPYGGKPGAPATSGTSGSGGSGGGGRPSTGSTSGGGQSVVTGSPLSAVTLAQLMGIQ
ncbi:MAG TPA: MCE family protein [Pseudonocardiaceae bacterium]|nr:MCE family protein [Pseudonocardiaceae bacterium]